ncbi:hypothetical protein [Paraburkholderia sp. GAS42]|uniref:hypothetical protein n=1 Tax=Paraburkholderia sp. GAS42 TaxID=3035135 RepID=UPI003D1979A9
MNTTDPDVSFNDGHAATVNRRAPWSFSSRPRVPLIVGHREDIDLRHRARDVEQCVDLPERRQSLVDDFLCGVGVRQVEVDYKRPGT